MVLLMLLLVMGISLFLLFINLFIANNPNQVSQKMTFGDCCSRIFNSLYPLPSTLRTLKEYVSKS